MSTDRRVVIAGAGVGGLETALALHAAAGDRVHITLLSGSDEFRYRAWSVTEPFTGTPTVAIDLRALAEDMGFDLVIDRLERVDQRRRSVLTGSGELSYDSLVLALGARPFTAIKGAHTFAGESGRGVAELLDAVPRGGRVAFVASASAVWSLPAYELAMYAAIHLPHLRILLITAEPAPLAAFGEATSARTAELLQDRGVEVYTHTAPESFGEDGLFVPMAGTIPVDACVALPGLIGPAVRGLPCDEHGFVAVDDFCRVSETEDIFAVGDMTARVLKQGGLAAQQGDVAAAGIARDAGAAVSVDPYRPVLRALLLTGEGSRYLREPPAGPDEIGETRSPWWPPHKIAALHLGPYLATHADLLRQPAARA